MPITVASFFVNIFPKTMFNAQCSTPKGSRANGENEVAMLNGIFPP